MSDERILVQKEYLKNPDLKKEDIQCLREWLKTQPHLPHEFITDLELVLALHCCHHDTDLTKKVIDLNYTLRTLLSFYRNRKMHKSLEMALHTWLITPLDETTARGNKVIYCHLMDTDPEKFNYSHVVKVFVMIMDLWQHIEGTMPGVAVIVNMDKVTINHISRIDLSVAQEFFYFLQEAMFINLKEFHFINACTFMDRVLTMVRPFMNKEMVEILHIHQSGSKSLAEFISIDALPREAGGKNKEVEILKDEIWDQIQSNMKFFEDESRKRVDESKRPGGPKSIQSFFSGLEESFKKLEID